MHFKVPDDWLIPSVKASKNHEQSKEHALKRKRDEMEASREDNSSSSHPTKKRRNGPRLTLKKKRRAVRKAVEAINDIVASDDDNDKTVNIVSGEPCAPPTAAKEAMKPSKISAQKNSAVADGLPAAEYVSHPEPKTMKVAKPSRVSSHLQARNSPVVSALPVAQGEPSRAPASAELKVDRPSVATASGSSTAVRSVSGTESTAVASRPRQARRPARKVSSLKTPGEPATIEEEPELEDPQAERGKKGKSTSNNKSQAAEKVSVEGSATQTHDELEAVPPAKHICKAETSTKLTIKIKVAAPGELATIEEEPELEEPENVKHGKSTKGKGAAERSTEDSVALTQDNLAAVPSARRSRKTAASPKSNIKLIRPRTIWRPSLQRDILRKASQEARAAQTQDDLEAVPPTRRARVAKDEAAEHEERQKTLGKGVVTAKHHQTLRRKPNKGKQIATWWMAYWAAIAL
ncbi:hypothetical protein NEOLEDRAFT_1152186 [Neolentinus lepideus HHB14362 ss-1]|uniref:Uncharacterized protein n=1 Tax=Neolentinus lepideus HHB14362 ss-1 TaxID=1314782 RepID=A0A165N1F6_9AGAM|nr:hypothetical protein NEOLEDRAFT_1152186 [Neolentinus lepideus HHB14362 ss-1]